MKRTIRSLHEVNYPVYEIDQEPIKVDGLVFCNGHIIDDQNIPAKTLGERRLLTPHELRSIRKCRLDVVDIIKSSKSMETWYIDNLGHTFSYRKTRLENLVCHRITKIIPRETYSLIMVKDVNFPIIVSRPPVGLFAQIIYYKGFPWKLYNILYEYQKTTRKKV